jgi:hypothetical protein
MAQNIVQQDIASSLTHATNKGLTNSFVTAALATQLHPNYRQWVTNTYGNQRLTSWIEMYGANGFRTTMAFRHVEKGRLQEPLVANAAASGAAGATVTLTLAASCLVNGTINPCTTGMIVYFKDKTIARVDSIPAATQIALAPYKATQALSIAAGEQMFFSAATVVGEGAVMGNSGLTYPPVEFLSSMDFFRYDETFTEEEMVAINSSIELYPFVNSETGETITLQYQSQIKDAEIMFLNARELYLTSAVTATNTTITNAGIRGITGVIPTIISTGTNKQYANIAGFQISDLQDMSLVAKRNNSPNEYMWWGGSELNNQAEMAIKEFQGANTGNSTYGAFAGSSGDALKFGYRSFNAFGITWHFNDNPLFMNPSFHGAAGMPYPRAAIVCPATNTFNNASKPVKYIEMVHLGAEGMNLTYNLQIVDGTGILNKSQYPATNTSRCTFTWKDTIGCEMTAAKHLFYVEGI